jgi:hypothetical protein
MSYCTFVSPESLNADRPIVKIPAEVFNEEERPFFLGKNVTFLP